MSAEKFCVECGERFRLARSVWPARVYCHRCAPRFRRRRWLSGVALLIFGLIAFAAGRWTHAPAPFVYLGTPIEAFNNASPAAAATPSPSPPAEMSGFKPCGAKTRAGRACRRKVRGGGFCWQHAKDDGARR